MVKKLPDAEFAQKKLKDIIRETTFQPIDFSLGSIVEMIHGDQIMLNPDFQRRERWDPKKKSRLIESFLLNIPIPPIFIISQEKLGAYYVIDGQQRLRAVQEFFDNKYPLTSLEKWPELNRLYYRDLQKIGLANVLSQRPLRTFELRSSNLDAIYDVFSRLNTGGITLNSQEIRNSTFAKYPFNRLIKRLGDDKIFWSLIGIKNEKDIRYKKMTNCELVLRYFAVRGEGYRNFRHLNDPFLNDAMKEKMIISTVDEIQLELEFKNTMGSIKNALGKLAFKNPSHPQSFMATLYDATVHAFDNMNPEKAKQLSSHFMQIYRKLWQDPAFLELFGRGTNTPVKMKARIERLDQMVKEAIGQ